MKLSILIPSKSPDKLENFLESFYKNTRISSNIELVTLVDDDKNYVEYHGNFIVIHKIPEKVLNISNLQYECYKVSTGDWIMLGNDDCIIETLNWDDQIWAAINHFKDGISLVYPNDNMFGQQLACFPIISRKLIELVDLFPMKYHRYKVDDTIFNIIPPQRKIYLPNCKFTHLNDKGESGYNLGDGRVYPVDSYYAGLDSKIWANEEQHRLEMSNKINEAIGYKEAKVLIGVSTAEMARRAVFYDYFNMLQKPPNTVLTMAHGQSPARARNLIIEQALAFNCTHILFLDDDTAFPPTILNQLLSHDKDIVTGLYMMRNYPHRPIVFDLKEKDGSCRPYFPDDSESGLVEVVNCGLGCVLIKTEVFKAVEKPWVTLGELTKDDWCDDISFFNRVKDKGFKIYCDLDCLVGHMGSMIIWPSKVNGKWVLAYDTGGEGQVSFPMLRPQVAKEGA